jgi:hypothetical protein
MEPALQLKEKEALVSKAEISMKINERNSESTITALHDMNFSAAPLNIIEYSLFLGK